MTTSTSGVAAQDTCGPSQPLSAGGRFTLLAIACLTIMVGTVVAPGLLSIASALEVASHASWLITLPSLGAVLFAPIAGRMIDRVGAYRSLVGGLFLYGVLGAGGALLEGTVVVFADRILLGGVTAVVMAGGTTLISEWYHGHARLAMIAQQGMSIELGGVIFLFVSGVLAGIAWQLPFLLYLLAWLLLVMLWMMVPRKSPEAPAEESGNAGGEALSSSLTSIYLAAAISLTLFFTAIVMLPERLSMLGFDETATGIFLAAISLVAVVAAMLMPKVSRALREMPTLILAFLLYAGSLFVFQQAETMTLMSVGAVLSGMGFGFSIPLLNHMTVERSHASVRGRNLSYLTMAIFLGQFLTSFLEFLPDDGSNVFGAAAVLGLIFAVLYLGVYLLKRDSRSA
ncbi:MULTISPECIES: MFS transporter [unclassified Cobetia]|uniref:MFS transporter n=1 Tax=unclassified Cobetia TaxID=2609414 RepID=UPI002097CB1D|nr:MULTISPECIES: MFS transporter [unclassified Cobetia]MCO7231426.1 MFS transporter [Cobetia sp. Dlab-2-AX]MCO7234165.1 MFS transporter [Cobetia sp. Dlab-2-U]